MPKIYKCKVYLTEFVKGKPVRFVQVGDLFTFKEVHQFLTEKEMKVGINLGPFRNNLVEYFRMARELAFTDDIPEEELPKFSFFPQGVGNYATCHGYSVELLNPASLPANDE